MTFQEPITSDLAEQLPLVVDLDGTLLKSDMLVESFFSMLATKPFKALAACFSLIAGRAALKARLAEGSVVTIATLPWNENLLSYLRAERLKGRRVYLASASDIRLVQAIADHLQVFDGIFASDGVTNLKSKAKAALLCAQFGERGFVYAGNETADLPVWQRAGGVIVVNAKPGLVRDVKARWPQADVIDRTPVTMKTLTRAMRVHQWLKNLLLFVPLLAGHAISAAGLATVTMAFLSFSLCASSVYVLNDLIDLDRDRAHPSKRRRPFAAGMIPLSHGMALSPILLVASFGLAWLIGPRFFTALIGYYALTTAYSLDLKRRMMVDVVTLACLYGARLVAGGIAASVALSAWLGAFSLFLFCSLALLKRCTELVDALARGATTRTGRAYRVEDLPILEAIAAASGMTAVQVFALYVNSDSVALLYSAPHQLLLICVVLIYWLGRMLIRTHRGDMQDDPVVFAATDRVSQCCALVILAIVLASL